MPNIPKEEAFSFAESPKQPTSSQKIHTIPSSSNLSAMNSPLTNQNEFNSKYVRRREPSDIFSLQKYLESIFQLKLKIFNFLLLLKVSV